MKIAEIFRSLQGEGRMTGTDSVFVRASGCNLRCGFCDTPYASWSPEGEDLSVDEILDRVKKTYSIQSLPSEVGSNMVRNSAAGRQDIGSEARRPDIPVRLQFQGSGFRVHNSPLSTLHSPLTTLHSLLVHCSPPTAHCPLSTASPKHVVLTGGEPMLFAELIPLSAALRKEGWHITIETSGTLYLPVVCDLMSISPKLSNSTPAPEQDPHWTSRHESSRHAPQVIKRLIAEYDYQIKFVIDRPADCLEAESYLAAMPQIDRARVLLMPQGADPKELAEKNQWLEPYCAEHELIFCPRRHVEWFGPGKGK
ncbi:MAG: 7-carboxy-7-deazaguanine synthase QueE [Thermoguttaceae bacterium]|jgi:7-carboxy-7-deazaguanine synthase